MARKIRDEQQDEVEEKAEFSGPTPAEAFADKPSATQEEVSAALTLPPLVDPAPVIGDATKRERPPMDGPPPPPPKKWRVEGPDRPVMNRGFRVTLRSGKIVDEANYDIAHLRAQGVMLAEVAA